MQKISTKIFIGASILFGILGIILVISTFFNEGDNIVGDVIPRLLMITVFVILPSFALSIAGKFLKNKWFYWNTVDITNYINYK